MITRIDIHTAGIMKSYYHPYATIYCDECTPSEALQLSMFLKQECHQDVLRMEWNLPEGDKEYCTIQLRGHRPGQSGEELSQIIKEYIGVWEGRQ